MPPAKKTVVAVEPELEVEVSVETEVVGVPDRESYFILNGGLYCKTPYGNLSQILNVTNYGGVFTAPQYHEDNFDNPNFPHLSVLKKTDLVLVYPGLIKEQYIKWDGTVAEFLHFISVNTKEEIETLASVGDHNGEADQTSN